MSLSEGFAIGVTIMMVGVVALTAFAFWIASTEDKRQEKEADEVERRAFRKSFTIHQN